MRNTQDQPDAKNSGTTSSNVPGEMRNMALLVAILVLLVAGSATLAYYLSRLSYKSQYSAALSAYDEAVRLSTPDSWSRAISDADKASSSLYCRLSGSGDADLLAKKVQEASDLCMAYRALYRKLTYAHSEARRLDTFEAWDAAYALSLELLQSPYLEIIDKRDAAELGAEIAGHFNANCAAILDRSDFELSRTANDAPPEPIPTYYGDARILATFVLDNPRARPYHARAREISNRIATALNLRTQYANLLEVAEKTYLEAIRQNSSELWVAVMKNAKEALAVGFSRYGNTARAARLALEGEESLFNLALSWHKIARSSGDVVSRQEAYGNAADVLKQFASLDARESVKTEARNLDAQLLEERRLFGEYTKLLSIAVERAVGINKANPDALVCNAVALAAKKAADCPYSTLGSVDEAMALFASARSTAVSIYNAKFSEIHADIDTIPAKGVNRLLALEAARAKAQSLAAAIPADYANLLSDKPGELTKTIMDLLSAGVSFGAHKNQIRAIAVSPGMKFTATSCVDSDCDIYIWDSETGNLAATLDFHKEFVTCLSFTPDGKYLISGGWDKRIIGWETATWKRAFELDGHYDKVISLSISNGGLFLAAGLWTGGCAIWHIATRQLLFVQEAHNDTLLDLCFSPNDSLLATAGSDGLIVIIDMDLGEEVAVVRGHSSSIYGIAFSPDGSMLAAASGDGILSIWSNPEFMLSRFATTGYVFQSVQFLRNTLLATISNDETVRIWNANTLESIASVSGASHFGRIVVSSCGRYIFIPGKDGRVHVRNINSLLEIRQ